MNLLRKNQGEELFMVLQESFDRIYTKFKLHFYRKVFEKWNDREASLTTVETFCMEIINALKNPTVNEFAEMANLSSPNAAYKVNSLIKKGYLRKVRAENDKRKYYLEVTEKYKEYYNISYQYISTVMKRIEERFTPEELAYIVKVMDIIETELMPEIDLKK